MEITSISLRLPLFVLVVALVTAAGCATNPATGGSNFVFMSEEEEIRLGKQVHQQVLQQYGVIENKALQDYVYAVGSKVAAVAERPQLDWHFTALDSEEVNAFAAPGGYIYITRGLMAFLNSEAELAAVLGHEVGHVTARHAARQQSQSAVTGVLGAIAAAATGVVGADYVTSMLGAAVTSGYGRKMELEADGLGANYLARAGYSPQAMIKVISVLKAQELFEIERAADEGRKPQIYHGLFASHPDQDTRLQEVVAEAQSLAGSGQDIDNRFTYLHFTDGLTFGKKSKIKLQQTGEVLHANLNVAVRTPLGWNSQITKHALTVTSPDGDGIVQLTRLPADARVHPREMLRAQVGPSIRFTREEERNLNGNAGFTAVGLRAPSPFGARAVRYGLVYIGRNAFLLAGSTERVSDPYKYDTEFLRAFESLRKLSGAERRASAAAIIRIRRADEGTTVMRLVDVSRNRKYAEQEIRLINGWYPEGEPEPGQYVKILE